MLTQPLVGDARGRIINITSQHGMVGPPGHFAYSVGKGGLVQMTRQIAVDYGRDGIICNAVAPGKIVTGTPGDLSADEQGLGLRAVTHARSRGWAAPRTSHPRSHSLRATQATSAAST